MRKLTIKISEWLRGSVDESCLMNEHGKKCCLGFELLECGFDEEQILNIGCPSFVVGILPEMWAKINHLVGKIDDLGHYLYRDTVLCEELIAINDDHKTTDEYKIENITRVFRELGVEVEFVP